MLEPIQVFSIFVPIRYIGLPIFLFYCPVCLSFLMILIKICFCNSASEI